MSRFCKEKMSTRGDWIKCPTAKKGLRFSVESILVDGKIHLKQSEITNDISRKNDKLN